MPINPLAYTEEVVKSFLRYQLTAYPFSDERLHEQMRCLLSLEDSRDTPLLRGPYISLSRAFRTGATIEELVDEGLLHPHTRQLIPFPAVYGHQEESIRAIREGRPTLISTGTGSGKSECFLYPIISRCLELRDQDAAPGIRAVLVYPMNALAEDQLGRLRGLLAGTGISFGMYVGKTPEKEEAVTGRRLGTGSTSEDYRAALEQARRAGSGESVHPPEEVCSRRTMRRDGSQPRILLTNVKQLELLLTRQRDVELFDGAALEFLVFDEAHTFTGAQGAESACLIRRLRSFCGAGDSDSGSDTVCVATSATLVDEADSDASRDFAARFFGVPASRVATVGESYEDDPWSGGRTVPPAPGDPASVLQTALAAIGSGNEGEAVGQVWEDLGGRALDGDWRRELHRHLSRNELLYQLTQLLEKPQPVAELLRDLGEVVGRPVTEEEVLLWLTLGSAARDEGRPLVRPLVHGFLRGVPGAVVHFGDGTDPVLHLSAEDDPTGDRLHLHILTCTTCGQHYFEHFLADFEFTGTRPGGGQADGRQVYWQAQDAAHGASRLILVDRLISQDDEDAENPSLGVLFLCRDCGTAHRTDDGGVCRGCGRQGDFIELSAVRQKEDREGYLHRCSSCGANGRFFAGQFREPARPVRATNVADVFVLAQDMVHHAERKRLLLFADNRQDAAFQAGWMRDHARRFRLRALMLAELDTRMAVGDLVHRLNQTLEANDPLSRALLPEVWAFENKSSEPASHRDHRSHFLRISVLRELTASLKQRVGLEPWGRLRVDYRGIEEHDAFLQEWSNRLGLSAEDLRSGVIALLDLWRRRMLLFDSKREIFGRFWNEGDLEIQRGYLPRIAGIPRGMKLQRDHTDDKARLSQWISPGHATTMSEVAGKWGVPADDVPAFLEELWEYLADPERAILRAVTLKGSKGRPLPKCSGAYQIDGDKLLLSRSEGACLCTTCRRRSARRTPHDRCLAWHCHGELVHQPEDPDNYDLSVLDQNYTMLRPREHTAMVPHKERERLEEHFKGGSDAINALVCTQTLELGVDIGSLDSVLMRNVPPLPANYWQRAGRAGRRHRMAVSLTYARPVSHDRAYFQHPEKMLGGRVEPPSFYLSNPLMVAKHVHATVLTALQQLARPDSELSDASRGELQQILARIFPDRVTSWLFEDTGEVRPDPYDVSPLEALLVKHRNNVEDAVHRAFRVGWPEADAAVVTDERLGQRIAEMPSELRDVVGRLHRRLHWALDKMAQLEVERRKFGSLDEERRAFHRRCERLVNRLKGVQPRAAAEAEGLDDVVTYGVLAAEGFLPGYGLDVGTVLGIAETRRSFELSQDFTLPRPPAVALREYVPGNLIYTGGNKFVARRYALEAVEASHATRLEVDYEGRAVRESSGAPPGDPDVGLVTSLPISDVTLVQQDRISDEEDFRFQMGVAVFARELGQHEGGTAYDWGPRQFHLLRGLRLQLVNVGARTAIGSDQRFGYDVCQVCGMSVSPFSSDRQRQDFGTKHLERCGQKVERVAFHADLAVDALRLAGCSDTIEAYSMGEALRFAAASILDMDREDLHLLLLGQFGSDEVDLLIYDPMPGGSGLLQQACLRFEEVAREALRMASDCPSRCDSSCTDCYQTYRNAFYHGELDRNRMRELLGAWGTTIEESHIIPQSSPKKTGIREGLPVNTAEKKLENMLAEAGLPTARWQAQRKLPPPLRSTTPDVTFDDPDEEERKIFIYLDGLSKHIHGNPATAQRDQQIRAELRAEGHDVIEITAHDLDDPGEMTKHLKRLGRLLSGRDTAQEIAKSADRWFAARDRGRDGSPGTSET